TDFPFNPEDHIMDMIDYYTHKIFDADDSAEEDFVKRALRYVKRCVMPECVVINQGDLGADVVSTFKCETRQTIKTKFGDRIITVNIFSLLMNNIDVYSRLPVYETITFNPNPAKSIPYKFNMYNGFVAER